ncbi:uncharacterized protein LOC142527397 [Primulina tabacum]|uniref:uncharacterized protein LOC142527397 n=1 Tax=Primulina tabacum TaxID=48773 RepID=UPI003F59E6E8
MRSSGVFFVLFLVVAAVILNKTDVDCKATTEKIEEEAAGEGKQAKGSDGGSESWAEWAKDKLSFKSADDQDGRYNANQDKPGCVKDKARESAEEARNKAAEAYDKTGEAKDKVEEKVCDMGKKLAEESKKRAAEAEDTLYWAEERAKEGYEAAKSMAEETYESGKEKLSHHQEL